MFLTLIHPFLVLCDSNAYTEQHFLLITREYVRESAWTGTLDMLSDHNYLKSGPSHILAVRFWLKRAGDTAAFLQETSGQGFNKVFKVCWTIFYQIQTI